MIDPNTPTVGQPPVAEGEPVDATAEIAYWTPKVQAYSDDELMALYKFRTRDLAAACHDMPEGLMHSMTNVELAYMERELLRRLAQSRPAPADAGMVEREGTGK